MATRFYLTDTAEPFSALNRILSSRPGEVIIPTDDGATVNGPSQIFFKKNGSQVAWLSPPLGAITIAGPITINLWGKESNAAANVGFCVLLRLMNRDESAFVGSGNLFDGAEGVELGTSMSQHNFSASPASPVAITAGWRFRLDLSVKDAGGTMASGNTFRMDYNAPTFGSDGFSFIEFTENVTLDLYPTPSQDGPYYLKYLKRKKDYNEITVRSVFEDGGVDTLEHALDASQRYEFLYDGLSETQAAVLDTFWNAHRLSQSFSLIEPRDEPWTHSVGSTVEVKFESYDGDHTNVESQSRKVVLIKYPA